MTREQYRADVVEYLKSWVAAMSGGKITADTERHIENMVISTDASQDKGLTTGQCAWKIMMAIEAQGDEE